MWGRDERRGAHTEEEPACYCETCKTPLYGDDALFTVSGAVCDSCLRDGYAVSAKMHARRHQSVMEYINEREEKGNERITV